MSDDKLLGMKITVQPVWFENVNAVISINLSKLLWDMYVLILHHKLPREMFSWHDYAVAFLAAPLFFRHPTTSVEYNPSEQSPVISALSLTRLVIWNQLPVSVHHSTSVSSFKSSLKVPFPSCICPEEVCDALESMLWPGVLLKVTTVMKSSVSCYCIVFDWNVPSLK